MMEAPRGDVHALYQNLYVRDIKDDLRAQSETNAKQKTAMRILQNKLGEGTAEIARLNAKLKAYNDFFSEGREDRNSTLVTAGEFSVGSVKQNNANNKEIETGSGKTLFPMEIKRLEQLMGFVHELGKCATFVEVCDRVLEYLLRYYSGRGVRVLVPGDKMSIFVMHHVLIEAVDSAKHVRFYYKKAKIEGQPIGLIAESESSYSEPEFRSIHEINASASFANSLSGIAKNPKTRRLYVGIQVERGRFGRQKSGGRNIHEDPATKPDEMLLRLMCAFLELKLSWLVQETEQRSLESKFDTFVEMEGALIVEKQYYEFATAFRQWLPRVTRFAHACIIFYDLQGTHRGSHRGSELSCRNERLRDQRLPAAFPSDRGSHLRCPQVEGISHRNSCTEELRGRAGQFRGLPPGGQLRLRPLARTEGTAIGGGAVLQQSVRRARRKRPCMLHTKLSPP